MGPGHPEFSKFWRILVITMSARTADSALRARRPRAIRHYYFMIQMPISVDPFYTSSKKMCGSRWRTGQSAKLHLRPNRNNDLVLQRAKEGRKCEGRIPLRFVWRTWLADADGGKAVLSCREVHQGTVPVNDSRAGTNSGRSGSSRRTKLLVVSTTYLLRQ